MNRIEYVVLAKVIIQHPPRTETTKRLDDLKDELQALKIKKWAGESYRIGFRKRMFYKFVCLGDKVISIGDCAMFLTSAHSDRPVIGKIYSMWETKFKKMKAKVFWFYHPEDTENSALSSDVPYPGALFKSSHHNVVDIQTIVNRCDVISFDEFKTIIDKEPERLSTIYDKNELFYLAGEYEPVMELINVDASVISVSKNK